MAEREARVNGRPTTVKNRDGLPGKSAGMQKAQKPGSYKDQTMSITVRRSASEIVDRADGEPGSGLGEQRGADKKKSISTARTIRMGTYTIPEIPFIERTDERLTNESVPYEMGMAYFREIVRGQNRGDGNEQSQGRAGKIFHHGTGCEIRRNWRAGALLRKRLCVNARECR